MKVIRRRTPRRASRQSVSIWRELIARTPFSPGCVIRGWAHALRYNTRPPMSLPHGWAFPPFRIDDVTKRSQHPHRSIQRRVVMATLPSAHWSNVLDVPTRIAGSRARPNESPQVVACQSVRVLYLIIFPRPAVPASAHRRFSLVFSRLLGLSPFLVRSPSLSLSLSLSHFLSAFLSLSLYLSLAFVLSRSVATVFVSLTTVL